MKNVFLMMCFILGIFFMPMHVLARENNNTDSCNSYKIVSDNVIYDTVNKEYHVFQDVDTLTEFLNCNRMIENGSLIKSKIMMYSGTCLPGDPGYPNCTNRYIIKTTLENYGNTTRTGLKSASNYLLGNNGWIYGPGTCGLSIGVSYSADFQFSEFAGASISVEVSGSYSFDVPKGKKGNIIYQGVFDVTPKRYKYQYNDGTVSYSSVFNSFKLVNGTGGFASVLKSA